MPEEGEILPLSWVEELLETSFFKGQSTDRIEAAYAFSQRLNSLGLCVRHNFQNLIEYQYRRSLATSMCHLGVSS